MKMKIVVTLKSGKTVELSKEEYEELQKELNPLTDAPSIRPQIIPSTPEDIDRSSIFHLKPIPTEILPVSQDKSN